MNELFAIRSNESWPLAREFAGAYRRMVDCLRRVYGKDDETALAEAASCSEPQRAEALDGDPANASWHDLDRLADEDPALALRRWGRREAGGDAGPRNRAPCRPCA